MGETNFQKTVYEKHIGKTKTHFKSYINRDTKLEGKDHWKVLE